MDRRYKEKPQKYSNFFFNSICLKAQHGGDRGIKEERSSKFEVKQQKLPNLNKKQKIDFLKNKQNLRELQDFNKIANIWVT